MEKGPTVFWLVFSISIFLSFLALLAMMGRDGIRPQAMLQIEKQQLFICQGNGVQVRGDGCTWCFVETEKELAECVNKVAGTQK